MISVIQISLLDIKGLKYVLNGIPLDEENLKNSEGLKRLLTLLGITFNTI